MKAVVVFLKRGDKSERQQFFAPLVAVKSETVE